MGAANALLHNSNASAAAMGVIGNMNKYSDYEKVKARSTDRYVCRPVTLLEASKRFTVEF
ncbi:hypothetical protein PMm318_A22300 [Pseudomonas moorei]